MSKFIKRAGLFLPIVALCWACSGTGYRANSTSAPATAQTGSSSGDLHFKTPSEWVEETPSSSMRVAQYRLPRADQETEDASLVVYYFGQGQGGSTQANLDRWVSQMEQADGSSSKEKARTETMTVNGLKVSLLDVSGIYTAELSPGSSDRNNKPGSRMRAAVIETPKGAYFIKLVGPEKTISSQEQQFMDFVKSAEFKG